MRKRQSRREILCGFGFFMIIRFRFCFKYPSLKARDCYQSVVGLRKPLASSRTVTRRSPRRPPAGLMSKCWLVTLLSWVSVVRIVTSLRSANGVRSLASYALRRGCGLRALYLPPTRASGHTFSVQWFQLIPTGHDDNSITYVTENVKAFLPKGGQVS